MIVKEYMQRLKDLKEDRSRFERLKDRTNFTSKLARQENKYQAYIIEQMMQENRLVAASQVRDVIAAVVLPIKIEAFGSVRAVLGGNAGLRQGVGRSSLNESSVSTPSLQNRDETITVSLILVKLCSDVIKRQLQKAMATILKQSFNRIAKHVKTKATLLKMVSNVRRYHCRSALKAVGQVYVRQLTQGRMFDESFSEIMRNEGRRDRNLEESDLSLILDRENDCANGRPQSPVGSAVGIETLRLREETAFLKAILVEKNLELRKRSEECERLRHACDSKSRGQISRQDYSQIQSRNSSSYVQMERQVLGGCRIRKNGSRASQLGSGSQIGRQLLGKYMNECLQMRESMDMARELCVEIQAGLKGEGRVAMAQVVRILSKTEEVSVDEPM